MVEKTSGTPRYGQKTKTLESFPRVCHDPSRWITEVTPRPAAASMIKTKSRCFVRCYGTVFVCQRMLWLPVIFPSFPPVSVMSHADVGKMHVYTLLYSLIFTLLSFSPVAIGSVVTSHAFNSAQKSSSLCSICSRPLCLLCHLAADF
jgi:hypothetical protein